MTEIKVCGITCLRDAVAVAEAGADAMGFIFYPASPRFVTPQRVREIVQRVGSRVVKVGVFVNQDPREVEEIMNYCGLDMIQLHGDEPPEYCARFPSDILIKALPTKMGTQRGTWRQYRVRALLLDAYDPLLYGGTGKKADWSLAAVLARGHPLILSGGLNPENIEEALRVVCPAAVDLNSGVEISPGRKDLEKVKLTIGLVRLARCKDGSRVFVAQERGGRNGQKGA